MNITAVIVAVLLASVITAVGGFWLLPMLRRLHFGQTILEIGPKWHQGKQGTPTMGGLMFIIGIPIAVVVAYLFMHASTVGDPMSAIMRARMFYGLVLALLFGAIGFLDDYLKVVKKQNEGLTEKQKMALQILFGAVYLLLLHISGTQSTMVTIPYIGTYDFGVFYYVFAMFAIIALSNAVNFTDGPDGPVVTLSAAGGKEKLVCFAAYGFGDHSPPILHAAAHFLSEGILCVGVGVLFCQPGVHGVRHSLGDRRGGGVVQIDHKKSSSCPIPKINV